MDFEHADEIGPEKIVHVYDPKTKLYAIVVVDNTASGPSIGGIRMVEDVTTTEVFRLARAMTLKNAMAEIPHGGGKSGIIANPKIEEKETLIRAFARAIKNLEEYIPGPDMGTNEECMAWIHDEIGRCVGLPRELGGIPLDEIGATGFGVSVSADEAKEYIELDIEGSKLIVEGFGNVGRHAARFLCKMGAILVGASDSRGTIYNPHGIDVDKLIETKLRDGSVIKFKEGRVLGREDLLSIENDIFVPAARPDTVNEKNVGLIRSKLIVEGANIPITEKAEKILHDRGVLCIPDFVANAGGVIAASVEYRGGTEGEAFERIEGTIRKNTKEILDVVYNENRYPREVANELARKRVFQAMKYRRGKL